MQPSSPSFLEILRAERSDLLNRLRQTRFTTLKAGYSQCQIIPYSSYSPWLDDRGFVALHDRIKQYTMVDVYRCFELYSIARQLRSIPGSLVEVGVWRGGTAALLAGAAPEKSMHLFDTFTGVAKADSSYDTLYSGGEHADTDVGIVKELFSELGLSCNIHAGIFPDDSVGSMPEAIALAHLDVDTYLSARDGFRAIWPAVQPNGAVIFDDYGVFGCEGVAQAVNEIRETVNDALFVHNLNGHGMLFKRA